MTDATEATGRDSLGRTASPLLVGARLGIGLAQGAALWWLYRSTYGAHYDVLERTWPATVPELFGPLAMILVFVPVLLLAGAGRMRPLTLTLWALGATAFLALLGWHGVAAQSISEYGPGSRPPFLPWPMPLFAATALFIGHHLVLPADMERKWIAAFPTYFDTAWKAGVQLALSIGFTGAFWLLLFLGAALFNVIGLEFLGDLIARDWFSIPVTTVVFATAVHLTDVRDGLIRGVRSVVLMLLSWLLLLMTVLAAGFLAALPFTGLQGLWDTGSATALVLAAAAALIILINTAYQDGRADNLPPAILRVAVRVAAVLLTPLVAIAFWGLALRIGQHGLTPDRIIAFACAMIGAAYAAGYGFAALSPFWRNGAGWMQPLERTNVWTAVLEVVVILALFSPTADPARLSVADQVGRLERGAVKADEFDYRFLRFESGKAGQQALEELIRSRNPEISRQARAAGSAVSERELQANRSRNPEISPWPAGGVLPAGFLVPVGPSDPRYQCRSENDCLAWLDDINEDGVSEVMLVTQNSITVMTPSADKGWRKVGIYRASSCDPRIDPRDAVRGRRFATSRTLWPDALVDGRVVPLQREPDCSINEALHQGASEGRTIAP
ncbi:DUF4153 domain-containing protein [Brevundimonas sp.]|uniref:DUF4153 domain-containing protein n=1 Tax=Brevundimonas sp. TaxID=1871086 RepID=UPI002D4E6E40|nr:DUF4153 domain-containing protein [Brevundimonas sp.]HYC73220.1 DUF4153 domain-containing protein [Brevundimonas sp.]